MSEDKKKTSHSKLPIAGLIGAAAAGAAYLYGKNKTSVRKKLRGWMLKVKGEVMERIAQAETLSRQEYEKIVDQAVDKYKGQKEVAAEEFERLRVRLKNHWQEIQGEITQHAQTAKEAGSQTIQSAISEAIAGATDEIAQQHDEDIDSVELLKRAIAAGADRASQEVKDALTRSADNGDSNESDADNSL